MTSMIAVTVATAGLVFSLAMALLIEELIFGAIFRLFFGPRDKKQTMTARQAATAGR